MPYRALFSRRRLEWWLAHSTALWGLFLMVVPSALDGVVYFIMSLWMPAAVWGGIAYMIGIFHIWALFINGRRKWSPHVRLAATILTSFLFAAATAGTIAAAWLDIATITLAIPLHLFLTGAALCASWVAGNDSYFAYTGAREEMADVL